MSLRGQMLLAFGLVATLGCSADDAVRHTPAKAALKAHDFAQIAFIQQDHGAAYDLLSEDARKVITPEQMSAALEQIHSSGRPQEVLAVEYEPIPDQAALKVFLHGKNDSEEFHYLLVMQGTQETDYRVAGFFRGDGPYPPSSTRVPLEEE